MIIDYFDELFKNNKYLIKIYSTVDNAWCIYIHKSQHIQIDIQTSNSLTTKYIDVATLVQYIDSPKLDIKLSYTCYYDDHEEYRKTIECILEKIKDYYAAKDKVIHIKFKIHW
jgi:hypothetical protein